MKISKNRLQLDMMPIVKHKTIFVIINSLWIRDIFRDIYQMKKPQLKTIVGLAVLGALLFFPDSLLAQPGGGPPFGGGGGPGCWPPPCIPVDGGLSFLIAAGVAFGGKKLLDMRSK